MQLKWSLRLKRSSGHESFFFFNCIYLAPITWYSSLCYSCRWRRAASFYFPLLNKQNQESFVPSLLALKSKTALSLTLALHKKKKKIKNWTQLTESNHSYLVTDIIEKAHNMPPTFHLDSTREGCWKQHERKTKLGKEDDYFFVFSGCRHSKL